MLLLDATPAEGDIPLAILYEAIAGISYSGDFRMWFAEDPEKISKLVRGQGQERRFDEHYGEELRDMVARGALQLSSCSRKVLVPESQRAREILSRYLPAGLRGIGISGASPHRALRRALGAIVGPAALSQASKGLLSAGLSKSALYASRKIAKGLRLWA